jgi:hypothetical protein
MSENPYQSPESLPAISPGAHLAMPSTAARVSSMVCIGLGTAFATLAAMIAAEILHSTLPGVIPVFEDRPVPFWMVVISSTFATSLIGIGILIRRTSSRKRTRQVERS